MELITPRKARVNVSGGLSGTWRAVPRLTLCLGVVTTASGRCTFRGRIPTTICAARSCFDITQRIGVSQTPPC
ncbi:hypothetical protein PF005_g8212 [Phytophthora fragariae]|uniref:Uncharacterized protein n=1 Tax=Phytophthora fragariae TaxID=53985 RepID=A0A6A3R228_9STRA|nr:hypothetical protein PF009_g9108 [Phytophthora fragariae]KAE9016445.1 hypothetical protein PF011_g7161 [Phytophthora fragariae]KAE9087530.1 hypothetical protein PF007_g20343 [Phytophthora fragariae]KAE9107136.1 hypothetical protein PF006_g21193 [Phytophthora fragariae]KAE9201076.1 hypothetical protein PF002_g21647 [Phytophthora fragariae]